GALVPGLADCPEGLLVSGVTFGVVAGVPAGSAAERFPAGRVALASFRGLGAVVSGFAAVEVVPVPEFVTGATACLSGTEGSRWVKMSTARTVPVDATDGALSFFFVMTRTSSSRFRLALGFTRIFRNRSAPGETFITVPQVPPLGKIWSPPLVHVRSLA